MKKILSLIISAAVCVGLSVSISAQPRAIGLRMGDALDFSYEHSLGADFAEFNAGLDLGANGTPGFKVSGIYNFMLAEPDWTSRGDWGFYAGPGAALGYVEDLIDAQHNGVSITDHNVYDSGFMMALTGQVGLEYSFWFPLQLSVDIRPYFGFHINGNGNYDGVPYDSKVGVYDNGFYGFLPSLSVRYRF